MSQRHDDSLKSIRREYDDAVAALKRAKAIQKRQSKGTASRLDAAISTAGDAYALLLIATTEAFLREYLKEPPGKELKLSSLIDRSVKSINSALGYKAINSESRQRIHDLRVQRNTYAHGNGRSVFSSVPTVEAIVGRFLHDIP